MWLSWSDSSSVPIFEIFSSPLGPEVHQISKPTSRNWGSSILRTKLDIMREHNGLSPNLKCVPYSLDMILAVQFEMVGQFAAKKTVFLETRKPQFSGPEMKRQKPPYEYGSRNIDHLCNRMPIVKSIGTKLNFRWWFIEIGCLVEVNWRKPFRVRVRVLRSLTYFWYV